MPLYEYTCSACAETFEVRRPAAERREPHECPSCGRSTAVLQMSSPAVLRARQMQTMGTCPTTGRACGCAHAIRD
ncbi:MAG: FmdB family zinc ribbon protein [Longimicrobiales bacterium]